MIPQDIKDKVRSEILAELKAYFEEAEEHDDDAQVRPVAEFVYDFFTYSLELRRRD